MTDRKGIIALLVIIITSSLCCWGLIRYLLDLLPGWLTMLVLVVTLAIFIARRMSSK